MTPVVTVRERALDHPGDDLGVAVPVRAEPRADRQRLLVARQQRAEVGVVGVVVAGEGEGVPGLDAGLGFGAVALVGAVDRQGGFGLLVHALTLPGGSAVTVATHRRRAARRAHGPR
jgi:hypothetical protein